MVAAFVPPAFSDATEVHWSGAVFVQLPISRTPRPDLGIDDIEREDLRLKRRQVADVALRQLLDRYLDNRWIHVVQVISITTCNTLDCCRTPVCDDPFAQECFRRLIWVTCGHPVSLKQKPADSLADRLRQHHDREEVAVSPKIDADCRSLSE